MKRKTHKPKSKDVTLTVTQRDYDAEIRRGVKPNETFKPGLYRGRRGGFVERHPEALSEKMDALEHILFGEHGFEAILKVVETIEKSLGIYDLAVYSST